MLGRQCLTAEVDRNDAAAVIRMSKPGDFVLGPLRAVGRKSLDGQMAFPYVVDTANARTLYVRGLDAQQLREAPFVNIYARGNAKSILSVPWEAGSINLPRV